MLLLAALISAAQSGLLHAANIVVEGKDPKSQVTLNIQDANLGQVLEHLSTTYDFQLSGPEVLAGQPAMSTVLSGSLHAILRRLLRDRDHLIVHSADRPGGIAAVSILKPSPAAETATITAPTAAPSPSGALPGAARRRMGQ
jgi:hypothetical protein